jgi:glutamate racemase
MVKMERFTYEQDANYKPYQRKSEKKINRRRTKINTYLWSKDEEKLYVQFLRNSLNIL